LLKGEDHAFFEPQQDRHHSRQQRRAHHRRADHLPLQKRYSPGRWGQGHAAWLGAGPACLGPGAWPAGRPLHQQRGLCGRLTAAV